jgi:hypothetical protein
MQPTIDQEGKSAVLWVAFSIPPGSLSHLKYPVFIIFLNLIHCYIKTRLEGDNKEEEERSDA